MLHAFSFRSTRRTSGRGVRVRVRAGWSEVLALYTMSALPSGERESAVDAEALREESHSQLSLARRLPFPARTHPSAERARYRIL
jgi:hypothetical protein